MRWGKQEVTQRFTVCLLHTRSWDKETPTLKSVSSRFASIKPGIPVVLFVHSLVEAFVDLDRAWVYSHKSPSTHRTIQSYLSIF